MLIDKFFNFNYKILLLITLLYLFVYPIISNSIQDIFRLVYILISCILILGYIRFYKLNVWYVFSFLFLFSIAILSVFITEMSFSGENIYHLTSFLIFVLLIISQNSIKINKSMLNYIYFFSVISAVVFIIYSQGSYAYWNGKDFVDRLTLGLYNANFTGMMLFFIYSLIIITMKHRKYKFLSLLIEICLLYLIFLTGSRTSLLAAIFISIMSYTTIGKIKNIVIFLVCLIPFVFVKLYLDLYSYSDTIFLFGRTLFSGRQETFVQFLDLIKTPINIFIGNIGACCFANAHNAPLSIFASIGILGTFFYYFILIKKIIELNKNANTNIAKISIIVILSCFVHSSGEAGCFMGAFPITVFLYTFFILAGTKEENIK